MKLQLEAIQQQSGQIKIKSHRITQKSTPILVARPENSGLGLFQPGLAYLRGVEYKRTACFKGEVIPATNPGENHDSASNSSASTVDGWTQ